MYATMCWKSRDSANVTSQLSIGVVKFYNDGVIQAGLGKNGPGKNGPGKNGPGKNGPEKTVRGIIGLVVESVKTVRSFR